VTNTCQGMMRRLNTAPLLEVFQQTPGSSSQKQGLCSNFAKHGFLLGIRAYTLLESNVAVMAEAGNAWLILVKE